PPSSAHGHLALVVRMPCESHGMSLKMARPKRFELLTPRFVVWCSIQLSYGRVAGSRNRKLLKSRMNGSALPIGSPTSGSRPLADEREMQPEPLPGRIFNSTIAAEGRQNVAEKGHSFSER